MKREDKLIVIQRGWAQICLLLLLSFGWVPSSISEELSGSEQSWLKEKGEIVFVSQTVYPPFEFVDVDRSRAGMCLDLVRWITTEFGIKARFRDMSFEEAQHAVLTGKADVITSLFYSQDRDKDFDFTEMTWDVPALIFVDSERPDIQDLEDLRGKRIAMQQGDYASEFLKSRQIEYEIVPTSTFAEAIDTVVAGDADAVIGDKQIVLYHLFSNKLTKRIKSVGQPLYTGHNAMGVKEGASELQSILNKGIELARKRGVFKTISTKWTGTIYEISTPWYVTYSTHLLAVLVSLFFILSIILFWNTQLRRKVYLKTKDLRESEAKLRTLINTLPDLVWLKDPDGRYLSCNKKFERFFGAKESEIIGKTDHDYVEKELADFFRENDNKALAVGKPVINEEEIVFADDGHKEVLETIKTPMFGNDGNIIGILGIARDITERKNMAAQLEQASKLEAIGRLAGGVAHDLNNILSGVVSYPELLLTKISPNSELRKPLELIQDSGKRASAVVTDLLTVARGVAAAREISNLNILLNQYQESPEYKNLLMENKNVNFEVTLEPDLLNFYCSQIHVMKCLMNLVINGAESIQEEGSIEISTHNIYLEQPIFKKQYMEKGEYVVLRVADTGAGISQKDLELVFEPFYTRKQMGRSGTGLGLYIVWNTVQDHHGGIEVESGDGGTKIDLYFPATREKLAAKLESTPVNTLKGNGEKILVVDDEQLQRNIAGEILTSLGYTIDVVDSGEEALLYLDTNKVDLVLLDMLMAPGIDGLKTHKKIIKKYPQQKVIIVSGYSENNDVRTAIRLGAYGYIQKPYTMNTIGTAVMKALKS